MVGKGAKKKKKTKEKIDLSVLLGDSLRIGKGTYLSLCSDYLVFGVYGKDSPCHVVGIDVGSVHLGLVGLCTGEDGVPILSWFALISHGGMATQFTCDYVDRLLVTDPVFRWARDARKIRIELQMKVNPRARQIASSLRSVFRTLSLSGDADSEPDVSFVHGNQKYKIAGKYSKEARDDPLRNEILTGAENKEKRKTLGEHDCFALLAVGEESKAMEALYHLRGHLDQLHDLTDAYLLGRWAYEETGKTKKRKR